MSRAPEPSDPVTRHLADPRICFVGLQNLPVLSPHHREHGIGGEEVQQTLLARALARRGFEVSMVVADYGQANGEVIDGIRLFKAGGLDEGLPGLRFVHPRMTRLWAALARADADVYYVSIAGPQLGVVAAFARLHRRRVVFRIASDADCDPARLLVREARNRRLYAFGLRRADVVLAQTARQALELERHYRLPSRLAGMLVEPARRALPFAERDIDVLWVANLQPLKRPQLVLELARRLPGLRVHLAGGEQAGHASLYREVADAAAALPNVRFHGRVPYHEVSGLFERARVLVNSSDIEGFPNTYLQAWRHGVPVVAFFDPDHVVARFGLGAAVPTIDAMAAEVSRLAGSQADWAPASARCERYMDDLYGEERVLAPYLQALAPAHGTWPFERSALLETSS